MATCARRQLPRTTVKDWSSLSTAAQAADLITTAQTYIHTHTHTLNRQGGKLNHLLMAHSLSITAQTHTHLLMALFLGLPRWASTKKIKPLWILLKQETVSGLQCSDTGWAAGRASGLYGAVEVQTAYGPVDSTATHCLLLTRVVPD